MTSKSEILNNLREYTTDQIVEAINAGIVSMYELSKSGNLTPLMRRQIEAKLATKTSEHTKSEAQEPVQLECPNSEDTNSTDVQVISPMSDADDDVVIPEALDMPSSISINYPSPLMNATDDPTIEAPRNDTSRTSPKVEISNKGMFKRPFSFSGRIRRLEYGISFIMYYVWYVIINTASQSEGIPNGLIVLFMLSCIPMLWFLWAQNCKRCHDRGNSGWYQLIPFYFFVLLFGDGEKGSNNYGDNPKE